jgi:hypothetical protein
MAQLTQGCQISKFFLFVKDYKAIRSRIMSHVKKSLLDYIKDEARKKISARKRELLRITALSSVCTCGFFNSHGWRYFDSMTGIV